jgi:hypothetical protein
MQPWKSFRLEELSWNNVVMFLRRQISTVPLPGVRKTLCYIILLSMVLHCASRLGVLSHLYQKRHQIAKAVGLIVEIPIAMCSSDYYPDQMVLQDHQTNDVLPALMIALEINLFIHSEEVVIDHTEGVPVIHHTDVDSSLKPPPTSPVFHPPSHS